MFDGFQGQRVVRFDAQSLLEILARAIDHAFGVIGASIEVGIMPGIVTRCRGRALEPRDRLIVTAERKQVCANIVVRIAKIADHFDRALAFGDRVFHFSLEVIGPTEKHCILGGREKFERALVESTAQ